MAKKDKLRGFVFYTQDYFGDLQVRLMPGYLRIIWVEAFLLMDQSPRRGVLLQANNQPYSVTELAHLMNVPVEHVTEAFQWVINRGIASIDPTTKVLTCRRMVRERKRSEINSRNGRKGGNPAFRNDIETSTELQPNRDEKRSKIENDDSGISKPIDSLLVSVNRNTNRSDNPKPEPEPELNTEEKNKQGSLLEDLSTKEDFVTDYTSRPAAGDDDVRNEAPNVKRNEAPPRNENPSSSKVRIFPRMLFDAYNANRGGMEQATHFTKEREDKCRARLRSHSRDPAQFLADFTTAIQRAATIPFYLGMGDRGWTGNFDYFIKNDTNYRKPLERRNGNSNGQRRAEQRTSQNTEAARSYLDDDAR